MKFGFIYLWKDTKRNKFYLGSHQGELDDGYIGSGSDHFQNAYKKRPETFRRRILETLEYDLHKELRAREEYWLQQIKIEELGAKYYNLKRFAAGGDIISELSYEKREQHRKKCTIAWLKGKPTLDKWRQENPERVSEIGRYAQSFIKEENRYRPQNCSGENNNFYGQKHSEESLSKISTKLKGRVSNRKGAILNDCTKELVSLNNPNRKPVRTPYGDFMSASDFAKETNLCTAEGLVNIIKSNTKPIGKMRADRSPLFTRDDLGKTPLELGYYYISDQEVHKKENNG